MFLHEHNFLFLWDKFSTMQIAGSYGKHMFSFVRNYHSFPEGLHNLYPYQQCMSDIASWHTHQHLVLHFILAT